MYDGFSNVCVPQLPEVSEPKKSKYEQLRDKVQQQKMEQEKVKLRSSTANRMQTDGTLLQNGALG